MYRRMLDSTSIIILDGGLGVECERRSYDIKHHLWTTKLLLTDTKLAEAVHQSFYSAGADVASTMTYQASFQGFAKEGLSVCEGQEVFNKAVKAAYDAQRNEEYEGRKLYVAGSLGPYGAFLNDGSECSGIYSSDVDDFTFLEFHRPRIEAMTHAQHDGRGCDVILLESLADPREIKQLVELVNKQPKLYGGGVVLSAACQSATDLRGGVSFVKTIIDALKMDQNMCIGGIGVNCTAPIYIDPLLTDKGLHQALTEIGRPVRQCLSDGSVMENDGRSIRLIAYPNSHLNVEDHVHSPDIEDTFVVDHAVQWSNNGVSVFGGCCGFYPEDIRVLRQRLLGG